ncbi:pyridoxal-phosphate dependent enzyme [Actinokineospora auranticolor]|uniref:tryptophan synthase n=1 Tax=Actinokineospora auranticolor TaxID=155976 RepID=A0A2S6GJP4_9PSEU|nr:pyridoxal-phosphate dependent enzyme [Actinokineospora auranticolor]PPK65452.1 tryptophan synthase beta chain [Actinokineospora auranticolor]
MSAPPPTPTAVPTDWRSVLPYLRGPLPPDRFSGKGSAAPLLPDELARQCAQEREYWRIPEEVREAYARYRPTRLWRATAFEDAIGARAPVYVKYEGGNVAGGHQLNTALAQAYYHREAGAVELATGTVGARWGVALASACALFGLRCTVFATRALLETQRYQAEVLENLGASVRPSGDSLSRVVGDAATYAADREGVRYCGGFGATYSILHQSVIGIESRQQLSDVDVEVAVVIGAAGAGTHFGGLALPFLTEARAFGTRAPRLLAVESASMPVLTRGVYAYDRLEPTAPFQAVYTLGTHSPKTRTHAPGLRVPAVGKLISALRHTGAIEAEAVEEGAALRAGRLFTLSETIVPSPEAAHALAAAEKVVTAEHPEGPVLVCLGGHGYSDVHAFREGAAAEAGVPTDDELRAATRALHPVDPAHRPTPRHC